MLVEFKVSNFRSIKDEQTFSMVASTGKELEETHTFETGGFNKGLLKSAAIYGANASGKTSLCLALEMMQSIVVESSLDKHRGHALPVEPFKLDTEMLEKPTEFEIVFMSEGVRYQYGFSATKKRVVSEWLFAFPEGRTQRWFWREWKRGDYLWRLGSLLKGEKKLWMNSTRENALFLSTAVQLNSDQLKPVYDWFKDTLIVEGIFGVSPGFTFSLLEQKRGRDVILKFLKEADLGVDDIKLQTKQLDPNKIPEGIPDSIKESLFPKEIHNVLTFHKNTEDKLVQFEYGEESQGTRKMISLAGVLAAGLSGGHVVFVDELHNSLHLKTVKFLVNLFNNEKTNPKNSQLVFTSHQTGIMKQEFLRRDQVWFCEKGKNKATSIYSLSDFRPRKGVANIESAYLSGRYGALPYFAED